jgi:alkylresorcinol/alkylpyrone synthase
MSFITKVVTTYPDFIVQQDTMIEQLLHTKRRDIHQFVDALDAHKVKTRHLCLPLNYYFDLNDPGKRNVIWNAESLILQKKNIQFLLDETKIDKNDIGLIATITSTGFSLPSMEVSMMNTFHLPFTTKRLPIWGLGSNGGVFGINQVHEYLKSYPQKAAILLVTELGSLNFQFGTYSGHNLEHLLFTGDGAGAVLMVGRDHPLSSKSPFEVLDTDCILCPNTENLSVMDMTDSGFQYKYCPETPKLIASTIKASANQFLNRNHIDCSDINLFLLPGESPASINAYRDGLQLTDSKFMDSWESLEKFGNTSSVSTLEILKQTLSSADISPNKLALMLSIGAGMSFEFSLLKKV